MIMTILTLIGIFILGYALGNFSPAYLFGKWAGGVDIREKGSGNAGATNVMRVLGWRYGLLVFVLDALKGLAAVAIGMWLGGNGGRRSEWAGEYATAEEAKAVALALVRLGEVS